MSVVLSYRKFRLNEIKKKYALFSSFCKFNELNIDKNIDCIHMHNVCKKFTRTYMENSMQNQAYVISDICIVSDIVPA